MKFIFSFLLFFSGFVYSASFDCAKARTPMEIAICSNPELGKLDEKLGSTYNDLKTYYSEPFFKTVIRKDQLNWLKTTSKKFESEKNIQNLINAFNSRISTLGKGKTTTFGYKIFNGQIDTTDKNINEIQKNGYVTILSQDLIFSESDGFVPSTDSSPTPKCYQFNKFYSVSKKTELNGKDLFNTTALKQIAIELFKDPNVKDRNLDKGVVIESITENLENRIEEVSIKNGILTVNHIADFYSGCADTSASVNLSQVKNYLTKYLQNQLGL
jgi:uncharacterized protein